MNLLQKYDKSGGIRVRNVKKIIAAAVVSVFAMSAVGCGMIEKTPEAIGKTVVAKVGSKKITRAELDAHPYLVGTLEQYKQQYGENYAQSEEVKENLKQAKIQVLNEMTAIEALMQEAERLKLVPKEEELNKEIDKSIADIKTAQSLKDDKTYQEFLKAQGVTEKSFREILRQNVIITKLQNELTKEAKIEDKEIQEYYNKYKDKYPKDSNNPTKLTLAHILVADEAQAKSIKDQLDKGGNFADLAKKFGTDGTKEKGGDLGTVPVVNSGFDEDFMNAAMQLKEGEISGVVKTQFGYHIIKNVKREDKPVKTFEEAKEEIKAALLSEKKDSVWSKKLNEIQEKANIKTYEDKLI